MEYYAVVDTNAVLSALLSKNEYSTTVKVLDAVFEGKISLAGENNTDSS